MKKNYKFFLKGEFSNWFPSIFIADGVTYNCGEQYMMHQKAMWFNDIDVARKIMNSSSPSDQKKLGRKVKNYIDDVWNSVRYEVVKKGLREKFSQNPNFKNLMYRYKDYILVEANPKDRIWGIGYSDYDALNNIDDWGQNLLGKMLNEISKEFFDDEKR